MESINEQDLFVDGVYMSEVDMQADNMSEPLGSIQVECIRNNLATSCV